MHCVPDLILYSKLPFVLQVVAFYTFELCLVFIAAISETKRLMEEQMKNAEAQVCSLILEKAEKDSFFGV